MRFPCEGCVMGACLGGRGIPAGRVGGPELESGVGMGVYSCPNPLGAAFGMCSMGAILMVPGRARLLVNDSEKGSAPATVRGTVAGVPFVGSVDDHGPVPDGAAWLLIAAATAASLEPK